MAVMNVNMMEMENNMSAMFPVMFFDGEREIDLGTILITPSMNFKSFQSLISHKIGISPHQITTYFLHHHHHHHHHHRRRNPVTSKFNFSSILLDSSSFFWVVLKRSRRRRRRRSPTFSPENFVLLRRNPNSSDPYVGPPDLYLDYANTMRAQLEREKDRYLMSLNLNSNVYSDLTRLYAVKNSGFSISSDEYDHDRGSSSSFGGGSDWVYCDVCLNSKMEGETVPFHWCKNDAVIKVFKSPAGPIAPPSKNKLG